MADEPPNGPSICTYSSIAGRMNNKAARPGPTLEMLCPWIFSKWIPISPRFLLVKPACFLGPGWKHRYKTWIKRCLSQQLLITMFVAAGSYWHGNQLRNIWWTYAFMKVILSIACNSCYLNTVDGCEILHHPNIIKYWSCEHLQLVLWEPAFLKDG